MIPLIRFFGHDLSSDARFVQETEFEHRSRSQLESAVIDRLVNVSVSASAGARQTKAGPTDAAAVKQLQSHPRPACKRLVIKNGWNRGRYAGNKIDEVFPAFVLMRLLSPQRWAGQTAHSQRNRSMHVPLLHVTAFQVQDPLAALCGF